MPASVQTPFTSAPEAPGIISAIFLRFMPLVRFIFLEWILRMSRRASSLGAGNSIFLSILPGLRRAESRMSMRLVAMMTLMFCFGSNPSSWFKSSSMVRCTSLSPNKFMFIVTLLQIQLMGKLRCSKSYLQSLPPVLQIQSSRSHP